MAKSLPSEHEEALATIIHLRAKWGFGLTRENIIDMVQ